MHDDAVVVLVHLHPDLVVLGYLFEFGSAVVHQHVEVSPVYTIGDDLRVEGYDQGIVCEHGCCVSHFLGAGLAGVQYHSSSALKQQNLNIQGS